jgi:hypothetical protein
MSDMPSVSDMDCEHMTVITQMAQDVRESKAVDDISKAKRPRAKYTAAASKITVRYGIFTRSN